MAERVGRCRLLVRAEAVLAVERGWGKTSGATLNSSKIAIFTMTTGGSNNTTQWSSAGPPPATPPRLDLRHHLDLSSAMPPPPLTGEIQ